VFTCGFKICSTALIVVTVYCRTVCRTFRFR